MEEVKIGAVKGDIPEIVYNRRPTRADGSMQTTFTLPLEIMLPLRKDLSTGRIIAADKDKTHLTTGIQVIKLGDVYILGLPGAMLVEIGLDIKKKAGIQNLIIAAVSNDTIVYVYHSLAYKQGGYEAESGTNLAQGAGELIVNHALELLAEVKAR